MFQVRTGQVAAVIVGRNGIREAYETGRGALTTRS